MADSLQPVRRIDGGSEQCGSTAEKPSMPGCRMAMKQLEILRSSMFEVTVEDSFAAGHYLRNYKGKCENPHGHNYKVRGTLAGKDLDKAGLLLDFKDLHEVMKHVIDRLDHQ